MRGMKSATILSIAGLVAFMALDFATSNNSWNGDTFSSVSRLDATPMISGFLGFVFAAAAWQSDRSKGPSLALLGIEVGSNILFVAVLVGFAVAYGRGARTLDQVAMWAMFAVSALPYIYVNFRTKDLIRRFEENRHSKEPAPIELPAGRLPVVPPSR